MELKEKTKYVLGLPGGTLKGLPQMKKKKKKKYTVHLHVNCDKNCQKIYICKNITKVCTKFTIKQKGITATKKTKLGKIHGFNNTK